MRLKAFKVKMYRPILDSGWIDISDITVVVGKNESGKTALLKALHKFNPFKPESYKLEREWPRGHRKERSEDAVVIQTRFEFDDHENEEITGILPEENKITGVEISKAYKGEFIYKFLPEDVPTKATTDHVLSMIQEGLVSKGTISDSMKKAISNIQKQAIKLVKDAGPDAFVAQSQEFKKSLDDSVQKDNEEDSTEISNIKGIIDEIAKKANVTSARKQIEKLVQDKLPTFIYMEDHKPFQGIAHLDQIKQKKDQNQLTDEDKTFLMILEMAGLDFEEEHKRANTKDKEQRMLDMNDASLTLTSLLADHWSQRNYRVRFEADGYHMIAFVSDEVQPALVPLNERSKGFQWFFSFDTTFLYETEGTFKNAIILLDEPGLHLHAAAQRDLLKRMKEYAEGNQLIYTTHMPFMIDMERLDNIRVCTESKEHGTKISSDFYTADEHARFPLQAALGLSISQSLFVGQYNLVVEGITDFWLISIIASMLREEDQASLDGRIVITPAGGATKAAYVGTMLHGQQLNVVVLLDSDPEGQRVAEGLVKKWIMKDRHVLLLGQAINRSEETTIEDLFPEEFYLDSVNKAYSRELKANPITLEDLAKHHHPQIIKRIDSVFIERGFQPNAEGWAFNKGRPAKLLLTELPKKNLTALPKELISKFTQLFTKVNEAMPALSNNLIPKEKNDTKGM